MLSLKATLICCLLGFVLFSLAQQTRPGPNINAAPVMTTGDDPNPLQAILREVKQIRSSIPRANLNSFNAEITLARIRLQTETIKTLQTRLDEVKALQVKLREESDERQFVRKSLEERLQRTTDPVQRSGMEYAIEQMRIKGDNSFNQIQDLRNQEYRLTNEIQFERNKLNEYNNRLDQIQREIESTVQKPDR